VIEDRRDACRFKKIIMNGMSFWDGFSFLIRFSCSALIFTLDSSIIDKLEKKV